jgi:hypothetical protein
MKHLLNKRIFMLVLQFTVLCYILFFGEARASVFAAIVLPMWALSFNHNVIKRNAYKQGEDKNEKSK